MAITLKPQPAPTHTSTCKVQWRRSSLHSHVSPAIVSPILTRLAERPVTACVPDAVPYLPPELHLRIIEVIAERIPFSPTREQAYNSTDLATLCACSLVCKLWLNTARARIWAGVQLSGRLRSMALIDLLEAYRCTCDSTTRCYGEDDGTAKARVHEKACLLATLSIPSFAGRVMHLSVRETRGNPWDPKWLNDALPYLAAHLEAVHSLEMERVTWEYLSSHSRYTCLESFRQAKELTLHECSFHTAADLCGFLAEFGTLEVLTLDRVHCLTSDAPRWYLDTWLDGKKCISPPSAKLRVVGVRGTPMDTILEWIISGIEQRKGSGIRASKITSVKLGGVGIMEAEVVGRFLKDVGEGLSELRVGFDQSFVERGDAFMDHINLGWNTGLTELHVFGLVVPSPPPFDPFVQGEDEVGTSLTQLTSLLSPIRSSMEVLSLAMYPADVRAISTVDFEGMARVFEKKQWAGVEEVRVVISNRSECGLGRVVKQRLRRLDERGVLRVNVGFDEREVI